MDDKEKLKKLEAENEKLKAQIEILEQELLEAKTQLRRAKNPLPFQKPSFKLVARLVGDCCMNLKKVRGGWLLYMGELQRKFKSLKAIWELLTQESWALSDIFNPPELKKDAKPRLPKRHGGLLGVLLANTPFRYDGSTGRIYSMSQEKVQERTSFANSS